MGGGKGGGGGGKSKQVTVPWEPQQPHLQRIYGEAARLYGDRSKWPKFYRGRLTPKLSPTLRSYRPYLFNYFGMRRQPAPVGSGGNGPVGTPAGGGRRFQYGIGRDINRTEPLQGGGSGIGAPAGSPASPQNGPFRSPYMRQIYNPAIGAYQSALNAPDLRNNPYIQPAIEAAIAPVTRQFTQNVLPSLRSAGVGAGTLGGSRMDVANRLATQDYLRQASETAARMSNVAYGQGLQARQGAMALAPSMANLGLLPAKTIQQLANEERSLKRERIGAAREKHAFQQNLPYRMLGAYKNFISGAPGSTTKIVGSGKSGGRTASTAIQGLGLVASLAALFS